MASTFYFVFRFIFLQNYFLNNDQTPETDIS